MLPETALALYNWITCRSLSASKVRAVAMIAEEGRKAKHTITRKLIGVAVEAARDFERTMNDETFVSDAAVRAVVRRLAEQNDINICDDTLRHFGR